MDESIDSSELQIRNVGIDEFNRFMEVNSFKLFYSHGECLGLFRGEELLCLMNVTTVVNEMTIHDFEEKNGVSVVGGFDMLVSEFVEREFPKYVFYYFDKRYGRSDAMSHGFCFYDRKNPVEFKLTKNHLNRVQTEPLKDIGVLDAYPSIYDCGYDVHVMENKIGEA